MKLFRDAVMVTVDKPGRSFVGQKYDLIAKAGRRRVGILLEVVELVPETLLVARQRPGGLFKSFEQRTILNHSAGMTEARTVFQYEISLGYIGKALNATLVQRLVRDNLSSYSSMLKELSELLPLPVSGK